MSVYLNKMKIGINLNDLFYNRKGDEMIPSKKDREFLFRKDLPEGLSNQIER